MSSRKVIYSDRKEKHSDQFNKLKKQAESVSWLRLGVFVAGAGLGWLLLSIHYLTGGITIIAAIGLFLWLIKKHATLEKDAQYHERLSKVNEAELQLAEGETGPYDNGSSFMDQSHSYVYDLDILGPRSVFAFINRTASQPGRNRLVSWLKHGLHEVEAIKARQAVVADLSPKLEFRQAFQAIGSFSQQEQEDLSSLLSWLNESDDVHGKAAPGFLRWLLPVLFLAVFIASFIIPLSWYWIVGAFVINILVVRQFQKRTQALHAAIEKRSKILLRYASLLKLIEKEAFQASLLQQIQTTLGKDNVLASEQIEELGTIAGNFDQRMNVFAVLLFNGLWGWDLHLSNRLSVWKASVQDQVPAWLDALAEMDAYISLATFDYNHPEFTMPVPRTEPGLEGIDMGHILIDPKERVNNDLKLDRLGQYGLVTGANMAGKSTFLRTVGVNLVLAQAGAPVCAKSFAWKPAMMYTSMRATDSVQDRASYFYAELVRLKGIADMLKEGTESYILLDEILRGTNSNDKAEGSRGFIEQLIQWPGIGLVATHDLSLASLEEAYPDNIRNLRFEIYIEEGKLYCNYKLEAGVSQNLNATFLMKQMGIVKSDS
ncbi:MAG: hypothetical protein AB8F95_20200 [Bacteroidia bacterium]